MAAGWVVLALALVVMFFQVKSGWQWSAVEVA